MDVVTNYDASSPPVSVHSGGPESEFNKSSISIRSSGGDTLRESESSGEIIPKFELDIACICEKLANLNLLAMHVETKESDFEAFVSEMDPALNDLVVALEFDFLSGLLNSEVRVLETQISYLQIEKADIWEFLSSRKHLAEPLTGMEDMLHDSEKSLEQSLEQVLEIKVRSANFERNLSRFAGDKTWKDKDYTESSNNGDLPELEKMKMQTVEHQRHILRMLEKSLKREIDLDKRVSESIQIEEDLTLRLHSSEQDVLYAKEEAEMTLEKFYEADHTSELLMEISRELLSGIKLLQFNLKGLVQREAELKRSLLELKEHISEIELQLVNEKASVKGIVEMENTIKDLKEQIIEAESRVVNAEAKGQLLTKTSEELKDANEKVVLLEKKLSDTKVKLQHVEACYEASQEEKIMLLSTIKDMGNVIDDLKKKVSQSEIQTESVEDKCIFLSESNEDLKKELSFVRGRVKCLGTSLHQTEETKKATAKDISLRTKLITDLVMQMALERERLQKQISSLKQENKILVKHLKKTDEGPAVKVSHGNKASSTDRKLSENDLATMTGAENKEALSISVELEKAHNETVMEPTDSASELQTTRNIDARELKPKHILLVLLILIIPLFGVLLHQTQVR